MAFYLFACNFSNFASPQQFPFEVIAIYTASAVQTQEPITTPKPTWTPTTPIRVKTSVPANHTKTSTTPAQAANDPKATFTPTRQPNNEESLTPTTPTELNTNNPATSWPMIFHDDFDNSQLNQNIWTNQYLWGRTNPPELQYYTPDAFSLQNGILSIVAEDKPIQGMDYSSGVITSFDTFTFTYGYVETKIRIPSGQGLWPALWLLDAGGKAEEIDIVEFLGNTPDTAYMTLHYTDPQGISQATTGGRYQGPDFSTDFHIFGLEWNSQAIIWYIDGVEYYRLDHNIPNEPMYLIANLAIGGNWPGAPDHTTHFPASFDIDYIRVFQQQ